MVFRTSGELIFDIPTSTPFILMLRPRSGVQQWVMKEEYNISSDAQVYEFTDVFGNLCQRLTAPKGRFSVKIISEIKTLPTIDKGFAGDFVEIHYLPDYVLSYLLPSRFCEADRFNEMASTIVEGEKPGYSQVLAIKEWIRENIEYLPGSSTVPISAAEVNNRGSGVCRDLAHLGIALCRSLSIPARIVVGYLHELKPMDMHAWFEAFVGGRWYTFDATQKKLKEGYVVVGYGRDATDVAIFNQFGPPVFTVEQSFNIEKLEK